MCLLVVTVQVNMFSRSEIEGKYDTTDTLIYIILKLQAGLFLLSSCWPFFTTALNCFIFCFFFVPFFNGRI